MSRRRASLSEGEANGDRLGRPKRPASPGALCRCVIIAPQSAIIPLLGITAQFLHASNVTNDIGWVAVPRQHSTAESEDPQAKEKKNAAKPLA
jgi:hypothetical protein